MKNIISWLKESHRLTHIGGGVVIGVASSLELKDKLWGGKFDWVDWSLTLGGVIVGRLIRAGL